jgi:hypothetical protein
MALVRLALNPGIDKQNTEYGAEGGWVDCDYVRFRYGLPEKIGGWESFDSVSTPFIGMVSQVFNWNSLTGLTFSIIGTTRKLYVYALDTWTDITPIRSIETGVTFSTTNGSTTVTVNAVAHGAEIGDFVTIYDVSGNPGGISNASLTNEFEVQTITADTFTIVSPAAATSTVATAGLADASFQIAVGNDVTSVNYGWSIGTWGMGTWGTPRPASSVPGNTLYSRVWQFDTYGEDVVCQLCGGAVYLWDVPAVGSPALRATAIAGAPTKAQFSLVSTPDRHLVSLGAETTIGDPSTQDPMFVRFSNQEDINTWEASATNTAGGQRLSDGNRIISALRSRGQILIFTDSSLQAMQYVGPPYTFSFQQLSSNCGVVGPHAAIDINGVAYWMCIKGFFVFDGTVKKLPCTVQDYVYKDINFSQAQKINVGLNSQFSEITWFYCSFTSDYIDRFVTYNYLENTWSIGSLARTAWVDAGVIGKPLATSYDNTDNTAVTPTIYGLTAGRSYLYKQESGEDADGLPITAYLQSGYFDISEGDNMLYMKRFIPDFKNQVGDITVQLLLRPYPQATASPSSLDPYVITPTTQKVDTRARGRQIALRMESDDLGSTWRFGTLRVDVVPDGLR